MKKACSLLLTFILLAVCLCGTGMAASGKAYSLQEFAAALESHTALLEDSFVISCDPSVITQLKQSSPIGSGNTILGEISIMSGIGASYKYVWLDDGIKLSDVSYYAGWRILCLWKNGRTDLLSSRERQTLDVALALVSGVSGTDLQMERYIYDALCARITYETSDGNSGFNESDCAIGALLNGRADCDGYADAMVLCCGLAGIPCRYMHGEATETDIPNPYDGLHMWNLVRIDGSWLMTDVTWGDKTEPSYLYFNMGMLDASYSYRWCSETLFVDVIVTADFSRHMMADQQPVIVHTMEDVYAASRSAAQLRQRRLILFCPEMRLWEMDRKTFVSMLSHGGLGNCSFHDSGRLFEIVNISLPDAFCFCDSESDVLSAIEQCSAQNIRSFTLYLNPSLADSLFADNHAGLHQLLSRSCLANPGKSYQYSEDSGSVSLSDVSFIAPLPSCSSVNDVLALVRRELPSRPASLTFALTGGITFAAIEERVARAVYSLGVSSFSYSLIGSRITLTDLTYYPDYCLASTESEVLSFLCSAKSARKTSVRIYCSDSLYTSLQAKNASRFIELLEQAGFTRYSLYYTDNYGLLVVEDLR